MPLSRFVSSFRIRNTSPKAKDTAASAISLSPCNYAVLMYPEKAFQKYGAFRLFLPLGTAEHFYCRKDDLSHDSHCQVGP
ncbi:unnamed protein product [Sphenostylis stenocarpa]|uniref:Uncharacterized protein n=1 Tax=Sphenostylis stenocarpa TaxID=92480 RepID=A0AA86VRB8_9FABA|nr:unnamed protein product [Sphenostylis stenocarpa]